MRIDPKLRELNIDLPACPATLVKLSLMMAEDSSSMAEMSTLIEADMALASAVVRTVNSAMFGLLKRVETVHEGVAQVAGLTYEIGLRGAFPPTPLLQALWNRAGIRGLAMGRIARQIDVDPWQAHTMGLFAETGRAVLVAYDPSHYQALSGDAVPDEAALSAAEIEAFGVSHSALGAALCQAWGLAREVADGVRTRSQAPSQWTFERPTTRQLLTIGAAVDALLLDPARAAKPDDVWRELEPVADNVGLHVETFRTATTRVVERLNGG